MSIQDSKQIRNQLIMIGAFILLFVPLFINLIHALTQPQPLNNLIFGVFATCLVAMLVIVSGWYWVLFAIHVRAAKLQNGLIIVERFFAPRVRIPRGWIIKKKAIASPSFNDRGYKRGTLFIVGMSSFYVPDNFADLGRLIL